MTLLFYSLALLVIGATVVAFLIAQDRRDQRERAERAELLQRIQAPHEAVFEHATRETPPPEAERVGFDDDQGYWAAQEGVSREQLADALQVHELGGGA